MIKLSPEWSAASKAAPLDPALVTMPSAAVTTVGGTISDGGALSSAPVFCWTCLMVEKILSKSVVGASRSLKAGVTAAKSANGDRKKKQEWRGE